MVEDKAYAIVIFARETQKLLTIRKDHSDSISISNISSRVDGVTLSNISSELLCT
jgi:hypothetical protein